MGEKRRLRRELVGRELARRSFRHYLAYVHAPVWVPTRLSAFLADAVQTFTETETGNPYDILLIETPPQHGKSLTVTESFPAWYLGRNPRGRVIEASYNFDTAERFGRKSLEKVERFGPTLFGTGKGSVWTKTDFELDNGWGRMISRGIMAGITGNPATLLLIDDPIKNREEADSQVYREKLWGEWQNTLKSRLAAGAKVIVIMTPWHEDDLGARLLRYEPGVKLLRLPVEAEENDPLGRTPGEALCPELGKDGDWLRRFKAGYLSDPARGGRRAWTALYQCAPRVEEGNLISRSWWRFYRPDGDGLPGGDTAPVTVLSVDAAFKGEERNDFVAVQVWSRRGSDFFLRHSLNEHLDFPGTLRAIRAVRARFPDARYVLIEDKANGPAVIQTLRGEMTGVLPVDPRGGKVARVNAVAAAIESGHVFLPEEAPFVGEFLDQFTAFPAGKHDDCVDAATQALSFLLYASGARAAVTEAAEEQGSLYDVYR